MLGAGMADTRDYEDENVNTALLEPDDKQG